MFDVCCLQGMLLFSEQNFSIPFMQDCWINDFALKKTLKIQLMGQIFSAWSRNPIVPL